MLIKSMLLLLITILSNGCNTLIQNNISKNKYIGIDFEGGIIVGSVTAPFAKHYHKEVYFQYRSLGSGDKHNGVITSGTPFPGLLPWLPSCHEDSLEDQCGRLFAINLPAGDYEIYGMKVNDNEGFRPIPPAVFSSSEGSVTYIGNLHVIYCVGLPRSLRGAILGGVIKVLDNYERDTDLIKKKYRSLNVTPIQKILLPDYSWSWRVSYQPHDWGDCGDSSAKKIQSSK